MKKTRKNEKPLIHFEVSGTCSFEFQGADVEASSAEEAKQKIARDIELAVEAEAGMTCGFEVDNLDAEAEMDQKCAICGIDEGRLSKKDMEIVRGLPCLEIENNEAIGAPHPDGEFVCPRCMDPKVRGKQAQKFRRYYMKIFVGYPNGR